MVRILCYSVRAGCVSLLNVPRGVLNAGIHVISLHFAVCVCLLICLNIYRSCMYSSKRAGLQGHEQHLQLAGA